MKLECEGCKKVYNIPDERLKVGKKVSFPCPACKAILTIDLRPKDTEETQTDHTNENTDQVIEKTDQPNEKLSGDALKKKILKTMEYLAPMPQVVSKARQIMADPNSSFKDIGRVLETDQAITVRVLKMANSAYYGLSGTVSSIHQASVVLGFETLGQVINVAGTSKLLGKTLKGYRMKSGFLWKHSLAVAVGSKIIAHKRNPRIENDAFSAGLIHDAGMLVLDHYIEQRKDDFEEFLKDGTTTYLKAEKEIFGFDHADIAHELCKKWNIPEDQTFAIKFHHNPAGSDKNEMAYILYIADAMAKISGYGVDIGDMRYQIDEGAKGFLSLQDDEINTYISEMTESVENIAREM